MTDLEPNELAMIALTEISDCIDACATAGESGGTGVENVRTHHRERLGKAITNFIDVRLMNPETPRKDLLLYSTDDEKIRLGIALLEYIDRCIKR